jgi:assimilatory nitrate reductase catalytic subunit
VAEGDTVRIVSRRGAIEVAARLTTTLRADSLFVPFHWGGHDCANLLTHDALDPHSGMPAFKLCAARLEKPAPVTGQATAASCDGS